MNQRELKIFTTVILVFAIICFIAAIFQLKIAQDTKDEMLFYQEQYEIIKEDNEQIKSDNQVKQQTIDILMEWCEGKDELLLQYEELYGPLED